MTKRAQRGTNQRQLRVGELMRKGLSDILRSGEVRHPDLTDASITVTEVRVSPDLRSATAFVLPLGGENAEAVLEGLQQCAPYLRGRLGRELELRYAPELTFVRDDSFDQAEHLETLLGRLSGEEKGGTPE